MTRHRSTRERTAGLVVGIAAMLALGLAGLSCSSDEPSSPTTTTAPADFSGYVQEPPRQVSAVSLPDVGGTPVSMVAEPGGLRIVYFGYTSCPDVCPATMSFVKTALAAIPAEDSARVDVDMITVDPGRDTAAKLERYVTAFVADGTAIRTEDPAALRSAADAFGANYEVTTNHEGEVEVSHSGDLFVVDDTGAVILAWPFGVTPTAIERDLTRLLAGDRPTAA